jgi:hypothetical protein
MLAFLDRFRYIFLAVVLAAGLLAETTEIAMANAPEPEVVEKRYLDLSAIADIVDYAASTLPPRVETSAAIVATMALDVETLPLIQRELSEQPIYRAVPPENLNPIEWVDPWQTKERWTTSWKPIIDNILDGEKYPYVSNLMVMGVIAQETGGDPNAKCNDFDTSRGTCAVGVMAIAPVPWIGTKAQLMNPTYNIEAGISILNTVYEQALGHGFRPGREATRATLAAYNCSWESLLADRCYSFGGWAYADKVLNYWTPLLINYLQGEQPK